MWLVKMYHKIRFLKFWENQLWTPVFKDTTAPYLLMDRQAQGRHIPSKDLTKLRMELHQIKGQLIQIMIREEFFQDSLSIYSMKLEESEQSTNILKTFKGMEEK